MAVNVDQVFDVFVMGDVPMFQAAFNAVAMIFAGPIGEGGLFTGQGGLGFGPLIGLGLLFSLFVATINRATGQAGGDGPSWAGQMLMLMMVYWVMFIPVVTVRIHDFYDPGITADVANVPIGVAMPLAVMSTVTKGVTEQMNTAFSVLDATGNIRSITADGGGFVSPLKTLNSLRDSQMVFLQKAPLYSATLMSYTKNCSLIDPSYISSFTPAKFYGAGPNGTDFTLIDLLTEPGTYAPNNFTDFYTKPVDEFSPMQRSDVNCEQVAAYLREPNSTAPAAGALVSTEDVNIVGCGSGVTLQPPSAPASAADCRPGGKLAGAAATAIGINAAKSGLSPRSSEDYVNSAIKVVNASDVEARSYMHQITISPLIMKAMGCRDIPSSNSRAMLDCMAFSTAAAQSRTDSAASASFFLNIMSSSMNLLQFIFICMTPLVAAVMVLKGPGGFKVAGGYLMFGAWACSWHIGAVVIDFYTQLVMNKQLASNFSLGTIGYDNHIKFLEAIQQRIGIASDMMAGVPLLMMAVMSGSVHGLTALAQRQTGSFSQQYNEKLSSPDVASAAPSYNQASLVNGSTPRAFDRRGGFSDSSQANVMGSFTFGTGTSEAHNSARGLMEKASDLRSQAFGTVWNNASQWKHDEQRSKEMHKMLEASGMKSLSAALKVSQSINSSANFDESEKSEITEALSLGAKAGLDVGDIAGAYKLLEKKRAEEFDVAHKGHHEHDPVKMKEYNRLQEKLNDTRTRPDEKARISAVMGGMRADSAQIAASPAAQTAVANRERQKAVATKLSNKATTAGASNMIKAGLGKFVNKVGAGTIGKVAGTLVGGVSSIAATPVAGIALGLAAEAAVTKITHSISSGVAVDERAGESEVQTVTNSIKAASAKSADLTSGNTSTSGEKVGVGVARGIVDAYSKSGGKVDTNNVTTQIAQADEASRSAQEIYATTSQFASNNTLDQATTFGFVTRGDADAAAVVGNIKNIVDRSPVGRSILNKKKEVADVVYSGNPVAQSNMAYAYAMYQMRGLESTTKEERSMIDGVLARMTGSAPEVDPSKVKRIDEPKFTKVEGAGARADADARAGTQLKAATVQDELEKKGKEVKSMPTITPSDKKLVADATGRFDADANGANDENTGAVARGGVAPVVAAGQVKKALDGAEGLKGVVLSKDKPTGGKI